MNCEFFFNVVFPCCRISSHGLSITTIVSFFVFYTNTRSLYYSLACSDLFIWRMRLYKRLYSNTKFFSFPSLVRFLNELFYRESKYVFAWQGVENNLRSSNWCLAVLFSGSFFIQSSKTKTTFNTTNFGVTFICLV